MTTPMEALAKVKKYIKKQEPYGICPEEDCSCREKLAIIHSLELLIAPMRM